MGSIQPVHDEASPPQVKVKKRRALLFGDSHAHAVQRAIDKRQGKGQPIPLSAHRLLKEKNGVRIGTTSFEDFLTLIAKLGPKDLVVSMIGGNQHAVYSTIQHPQPFDFFSPDVRGVQNESEIIPYQAIDHAFDFGLRAGDARSLEAIRSATIARVAHVLSPPPKRNNDYIVQNHESVFAKDMRERGVSPAELRLKFWKMQSRVLMRICGELGIEVMPPPPLTVDKAGFLLEDYYANDATHANWLYGERVVREIERRYLGGSKVGK
jgi:hypothetical protein